MYDGNRVNEDDTPSSVEMEDNGEHRFVLVVVLFSFSFRLLCSEHTCADPYLSYATDTINVMVKRTSLRFLPSCACDVGGISNLDPVRVIHFLFFLC